MQFACHHSSASMLLLKVHPFEYVDLHFNLHISSANITSLLGNDTTLHLIFCNIATNCTKMAILEFPIRQSAPNYIVLKYICVSRFRVLPAQYQILSSCPSLLYIHRGPMGIFNIRSQNFKMLIKMRNAKIFSQSEMAALRGASNLRRRTPM